MAVAKSAVKKRSVRLPAFAKINLCLHVLGKRADGYHELRTIFQAISLRDTLEIGLTSQPGITLESSDAALPTGPRTSFTARSKRSGARLDFAAAFAHASKSEFPWRAGWAADRATLRRR